MEEKWAIPPLLLCKKPSQFQRLLFKINGKKFKVPPIVKKYSIIYIKYKIIHTQICVVLQKRTTTTTNKPQSKEHKFHISLLPV